MMAGDDFGKKDKKKKDDDSDTQGVGQGGGSWVDSAYSNPKHVYC